MNVMQNQRKEFDKYINASSTTPMFFESAVLFNSKKKILGVQLLNHSNEKEKKRNIARINKSSYALPPFFLLFNL